jgi:transposase
MEGMLELKTKPNRAYSLSAEEKEKLEEQLKNPVGFGSYKEIGRWLKEQLGVELKYPTVYKIVRKDLGAKLKVPRKSHIYKDEGEVEAFKESFGERLKKK